jgi:hypothetical protein
MGGWAAGRLGDRQTGGWACRVRTAPTTFVPPARGASGALRRIKQHRDLPNRIVEPGTRAPPWMRSPSTKVPLVVEVGEGPDFFLPGAMRRADAFSASTRSLYPRARRSPPGRRFSLPAQSAVHRMLAAAAKSAATPAPAPSPACRAPCRTAGAQRWRARCWIGAPRRRTELRGAMRIRSARLDPPALIARRDQHPVGAGVLEQVSPDCS